MHQSQEGMCATRISPLLNFEIIGTPLRKISGNVAYAFPAVSHIRQKNVDPYFYYKFPIITNIESVIAFNSKETYEFLFSKSFTINRDHVS